jgi:hypothetical protein
VTVVVTAGDLRHSLHVSAMDYLRSTVLISNDRARRADLSPNTGTVGQFGTTVAGRSPLSHDLKIDPAESEDWTMAEERKPAEASRRIEAPEALIFKILANPHRHVDFDGSGMLRGAVLDRPISEVGDTFSMKMHRLGDDYLMLNYVVEFEPDRRIIWEPAPGDPSRAEDNDPSKVGIPAGYRWGYILTPDGDDTTVVTEVFDPGPLPEDLLRDGGAWINGANPVHESMAASLERLEKISTE